MKFNRQKQVAELFEQKYQQALNEIEGLKLDAQSAQRGTSSKQEELELKSRQLEELRSK